MAAYYNEIDPYCAQWLRNLIDAGHIAPGDVDERSIEDVCPNDLRAYNQCHFFAGIGVWGYALRSAGWEDTRSVWTGSCPCQPFSAAGKGAGFADERHLWPSWLHLISERKPENIFFEQVGGNSGLGWLDLAQADLQGLFYAVTGVVSAAAGYGAEHRRERIYGFATYPDRNGVEGQGCPANSCKNRQRGSYRQVDLRAVLESPFDDGESWSKPLLSEKDTWPARWVDQVRAYGNSIFAPQAQAFIEAAMEYAP